MMNITKTKLARLRNIYAFHRRCRVRNSDGELSEIQTAARLTLGFDKMMDLIQCAEIDKRDVLINIFAGAGGSLRLMSLFCPRLLIGVDIRLPGSTQLDQTWFYLTDETFAEWVKDLEEKHIQSTSDIRWPLYLALNAAIFHPCFISAADVIIMDPPFGVVANEVLGLNETDARGLFFAAAGHAVHYLRPKGRLIAIVPRSWLDDTGHATVIRTTIIKEIGRKRPLAIIRVNGVNR